MAAASAAVEFESTSAGPGPGPGPGPTHHEIKADTNANGHPRPITNFKRLKTVDPGIQTGNRWTDGSTCLFMAHCIFPCLDVSEGIKTLPRVCRRWRWLMANQKILFEKFAFHGRADVHNNSAMLTNNANLCSNVRRLYMLLRKGTHSIDDFHLHDTAWIKVMPRLEVLKLHGVQMRWSNKLIGQLPKTLRSLSIGFSFSKEWISKNTVVKLDFPHLLRALPRLDKFIAGIEIALNDKQKIFERATTVPEIARVLDDRRKWKEFNVFQDRALHPLALFIHVTKNPSALRKLALRGTRKHKNATHLEWPDFTCEMLCEAADTLFHNGSVLELWDFNIPRLGSVQHFLASVSNSVVAKSLMYFKPSYGLSYTNPVPSSCLVGLTEAMPKLRHFPPMWARVMIEEKDHTSYWTTLMAPERRNTLRSFNITRNHNLLHSLPEGALQHILQAHLESLQLIDINLLDYSETFPDITLDTDLIHNIITRMAHSPEAWPLALAMNCMVTKSDMATLALKNGYTIGHKSNRVRNAEAMLKSPVVVDMDDVFRNHKSLPRQHRGPNLLACVVEYKGWDSLNCKLRPMSFFVSRNDVKPALTALRRCVEGTDLWVDACGAFVGASRAPVRMMKIVRERQQPVLVNEI